MYSIKSNFRLDSSFKPPHSWIYLNDTLQQTLSHFLKNSNHEEIADFMLGHNIQIAEIQEAKLKESSEGRWAYPDQKGHK